MKMIKQFCGFAVMLLAANTASASGSCEGFQITIENHLPNKLVLSESSLIGASLDPSHIAMIDENSARTFNVQDPSGGWFLNRMQGEFELKTMGLRSKLIRITYSLAEMPLVCMHNDKTDEEFTSGLNVIKSRSFGEIKYTIEE